MGDNYACIIIIMYIRDSSVKELLHYMCCIMFRMFQCNDHSEHFLTYIILYTILYYTLNVL